MNPAQPPSAPQATPPAPTPDSTAPMNSMQLMQKAKHILSEASLIATQSTQDLCMDLHEDLSARIVRAHAVSDFVSELNDAQVKTIKYVKGLADTAVDALTLCEQHTLGTQNPTCQGITDDFLQLSNRCVGEFGQAIQDTHDLKDITDKSTKTVQRDLNTRASAYQLFT